MSKEKLVPELITDPEFESCIPPLTQEEFDLLEENIIDMHRVTDPIIVWNHNIIVDGHNRYRIVQKHPGIPYAIMDLNVDTREEVLEWICRMQLGRRNLTPEQKKFLIGKRYESEKQSHGGDRRSESFFSNGQNDHLKDNATTRARIAQENNVSESYVKRAKEYARGLDILEAYEPGIRKKILSGELKVSEKDVRDLLRSEPWLQSLKVKPLLRKIHSGQVGSEIYVPKNMGAKRSAEVESKDDSSERTESGIKIGAIGPSARSFKATLSEKEGHFVGEQGHPDESQATLPGK